MEKDLVRPKKCYICYQEIKISGKNIFTAETNYTKALICDVLNGFLGREIDKNTEDFLACLKCVAKLNEYDQALYITEKIPQEFYQLMQETEAKRKCQTTEYDEVYTIIVEGEEVVCKEEDDSNEYEVETILPNDEHSMENVPKIEKDDSETGAFEIIEENFVAKEEELDEDGQFYLVEMPCKEQQSYSCRICQAKFTSLPKLRAHRKEHTSDERFVCDLCGMSYKTKNALNIHVGLHNGISPYVCEICNKKFTQKGALTRHRPMHTGERPYQCDKCGKQFIHYSSFHMHKMAHEGVRDKKCEICGMLLRSTSHLKRHMLVHTGQKPHACPKCGQRFAQRYNMMSHFRSHQGVHRKRKHVCIICNKGFAKDVNLLEHLSNSACGNLTVRTESEIEIKVES